MVRRARELAPTLTLATATAHGHDVVAAARADASPAHGVLHSVDQVSKTTGLGPAAEGDQLLAALGGPGPGGGAATVAATGTLDQLESAQLALRRGQISQADY